MYKSGIQEWGTECEKRREYGKRYIPGNVTKYSRAPCQTFREMSPNIPGNVAKYSGECCQTFQGMSPNIPKDVAKYSRECGQIFQGMFSKIHCSLKITLSNVRLSKSTVGGLSMRRSFINLFHCLQSI